MQFSDGRPQAVDRFPHILLAVIALAAAIGWWRRARTKE
jgi:hypothetical protein